MFPARDIDETDPLRVKPARKRSVAIAAVTSGLLIALSSVTPAWAEETDPVPTTDTTTSEATTEPAPAPEPTPTEEPAPAPEPTPTEEPTPTPEPTPEPTPTPTPEPTPEPTPTPTPEPTPTPTPTPEPTPTPTPTPEPTPTPTPTPSQTPTQTPISTPGVEAPFVLVGDGPVARMVTTASASSSGTQSSSLSALRLKLQRATTELRNAEAALESAQSTVVVARAVATRLDERAAQARLTAETAAGVYLDAVEGDGAALSSMSAAFAAGNDLLAGLGGMERVQKLSGDSSRLREIAELRDVEADAAEERAAAAWAAVDAVPIDQLENAVTEAKGAVTAARAELNGAQTRLAAEGVAAFDNLPSDSGQLSEQGWASPVSGSLTDGYGPRPNKPLAGVNEFHRGTDIAAQCGTAVFAATGGVVIEAGPNGTYGNWVLIDHGSGVTTGYAHIRDGGILVSVGQQVAAGDLIAAVGSTGASTGCHLHFEVRIGGTAVDAVPFMAARGVQLG